MKNICLIVEYDGNEYFGFQKQNDKRTIQGEIEIALEKISGKTFKTIGAGRTDAGVSAKRQFINFHTDLNIPPEKYKFALNTHLPFDISIKNSFEVSMDFHSRYSAIKREYKYRILNSPTRSPVRRNQVYFFPQKLDFELMKDSCKYFLGEHDFSAFCKSGSYRTYMICTIYESTLNKLEDEIIFKIVGDTFLRGMVRLIVGTLILVGNSKLKPSEIPSIISKNKKSKVIGVPGVGLSLENVFYPDIYNINDL